MELLRPLAPAHRVAAVAAAISAAVHAAVLAGFRVADATEPSLEAPAYLASLEPALVAAPAPEAAPKPRPRPAKSRPRPGETVAVLPAAIEATDLAAEPEQADTALPELLALAQPEIVATPPALPAFRADALPGEVTIAYALSSVFADGEAEYTWKRDGDRYEIIGTAQAVGFFTLFLEGRIEQSTSGRVTSEGLKPERFTERRGATPEEGLAFDWEARQVEFRRGDNRKTAVLTDATVDWLTMIFQLAHRPPQGESMALRVYTQRRLYQYRLEVLGEESLDLPIGRARTLHLRHTGEKPEETVDVWLGIDQHYLPVKLRYPIARNRLVVEQIATSVRAR